MNKKIRIALGLAVSLACLWFVFRHFDPARLLVELRSASVIWFLPAAFLFFLSQAARSYRWKILVSPLVSLRWGEAFMALVTGNFMNNILPARGGEFVRAYGLQRMKGTSFPAAVGTVAADRVCDLFGLLVVAVIAASTVTGPHFSIAPLVAVVVMAIVGAGFLLWICGRHKERIHAARGWSGRALRWIFSITTGLLALRSVSKVAGVASLSAMIWLIEVFSVVMLGKTLHLPLNVGAGAALIVGLAIGVAIPAAPGFVGTYELFGQRTLELLGFNPDVSLAFVLVMHFFQIACMTALGLPCSWRLGLAERRSLVPTESPA